MATAFTLMNSSGANATFTDFGAGIVSANMPDRGGTLGPVVLGFENAAGYEVDIAFMGVTIGPVANRIGGAEFSLNGEIHKLDTNDGGNCLHSGTHGWHTKIWTAETTAEGICFRLETRGDENGFPGNVKASVDIILSEDNHIIYRLRASCDAPTPLAMTHHDYFNLEDGGAGRIDGHIISIPSPSIAELDDENIATGNLLQTAETQLGLRKPVPLSAFKTDAGSLAFDHHYLVAGRGLRHMARVESPSSGRRLDVHATADGVQFYSGQHIPKCQGRGRLSYGPSHGFALEPQARPNAVNLPFFPSIIHGPDNPYEDTIIYEFSVID